MPQLEREENLRDVIFQYKELKKKHDELAEELANRETPAKNNVHVRCFDDEEKKEEGETTSVASDTLLMMKIDEERIKMMGMEHQLETAHKSAQQARESQVAQQNHLRSVLGQYKTLQDEFVAVLDQKKELESRLSLPNKDESADVSSYLPPNLCSESQASIAPAVEKALSRTTQFYKASVLAPLEENVCNDDVTGCGGDIWSVLSRSDDEENEDRQVVYVQAEDDRRKSGKWSLCGNPGIGDTPAKVTSSNDIQIGNVRTRIEMFESSAPQAPDASTVGTKPTSKKKKSFAKGLLSRGKGMIGKLPPLSNKHGSHK